MTYSPSQRASLIGTFDKWASRFEGPGWSTMDDAERVHVRNIRVLMEFNRRLLMVGDAETDEVARAGVAVLLSEIDDLEEHIEKRLQGF